MRRLLMIASLLILLFPAASRPAQSQTQVAPLVTVNHQYIISDYGFAVANETVSYRNNGSAAETVPTMQLGVPASMRSLIVGDPILTSNAFSLTTAGSGSKNFSISPSEPTLQPGGLSSFSLKFVVRNIANVTGGTRLNVLVLQSPSINLQTQLLNLVIRMPSATSLVSTPAGYTLNNSTSPTYTETLTGAGPQSAGVLSAQVHMGALSNFRPIHVYTAIRTVTASAGGTPQVRDSIILKNIGLSEIDLLAIKALSASTTVATVGSFATTPLITPTPVSITSGDLLLTAKPFDEPIQAGSNFTVSLLYDLAPSFFSVSAGSVLVTIPTAPPIIAPVDSYTIMMSLPNGFKAVQSSTTVVEAASPLSAGQTSFAYDVTLGWASDRAVPAASMIFLVALVGFSLTSGRTVEATDEEGTLPEDIAGMIKVFEEQIDLVNGLTAKIPAEEPSILNREYFEELRGKLDGFRSRALQRLNEAKQRSATQTFLEVLGRLGEIERETNRATKDMVNLFEQYYTKQMRKETFDKLLVNYKKRLDTTMNQLSDQLHIAQRQAKML